MLLHLVSIYILHMGMTNSPWDGPSFASKVKVTCGIFTCANWLTDSLHQIVTAVHVLTVQAIDYALADEPDIYLLGTFAARYAYVEEIHICKTI